MVLVFLSDEGSLPVINKDISDVLIVFQTLQGLLDSFFILCIHAIDDVLGEHSGNFFTVCGKVFEGADLMLPNDIAAGE